MDVVVFLIILDELEGIPSLLGNPGLRHGKPGTGVGVGYGVRFKFPMGHFQVDYVLNAYQQRTIYFGFSNVTS
ncbi:hypothetical protein OSB04_029444 [Centaurea solstitialis]|uniref:Bacterial surface antigen (D15) domain-containing protein n=1 Tax=Centaurea solstitialis TaxID=347529 RepID=A0AA38SIE2_9ASTR|nr:hypothetical protein OSB04_029444 [Centaurea solstitialis]